MPARAIYQILSTDGSVNAEVGTRIYPVVLAQNSAFPAIAYNIISVEPINSQENKSEVDIIRFQIDVYGERYETVSNIAASVRTALDRYAGTQNGVVINKIVFENEADGLEEDTDIYRKTLDFFVRVNK